MKLKHVLLAIVSLGLLSMLLIPAPVAVIAADNLAANGDLELGNTNGWDTPYASIDTSTVYRGNYSLKLTATSAYSGAAYKTIPVRKNATITVSFYYRYASDPGSGKTYHVYTYQGSDASVGPYSNADRSFSLPSGCTDISTWQQISYSFNSGDYDHVYLKFCPGGNGSAACYIDNLVVTSEGGDVTEMAPYLTSFGTSMNRPKNAASNLLTDGSFESSAGGFTENAVLKAVDDPTAPDGDRSLYFDASTVTKANWYGFQVTVEPYTQYTFSAWVKSPRLSADNNATATFGVAAWIDGRSQFLVYEPYVGNGYGSATISTETMQLMATSPDDEWHLRSVTFYSGSYDKIAITLYGAESQLYLDDIALYKSANGVEYVSSLRTDEVTAATNGGNRYCADEDSLIEGIYMTTNDAQLTWSKNPAWRNGFLSFVETGDDHGTALQYTASDKTQLALHYIDWIDVAPHTSYTLTLDMKRQAEGDGRIALLDDDYDSPKEFYTLYFDEVDGDWVTYSVTFTTQSYSRIGFAIVDGGGQVLMDNVRLFETARGVADEPTEVIGQQPTLKPTLNGTSTMEMSGGEETIFNGDFENSVHGWDIYQGTTLSTDAAHSGGFGMHLKGDGSWGALLEQKNVPVRDGATYTISYWYKANASGANVTIKGGTTGTQYAYNWSNITQWTYVTHTFTVEGDTTVVVNLCGGGDGVAEDVYVDDFRLIPQDSTALLGVAFLFNQDGNRIYRDTLHQAELYDATVHPYGDEQAYRLVRMGAVVTNQAAIGSSAAAMTLEAVNNTSVVDVDAKILWSVSDTGCEFAVRVVNVPANQPTRVIYARPYYVFEKDGEEIIVYGDIAARSYEQ